MSSSTAGRGQGMVGRGLQRVGQLAGNRGLLLTAIDQGLSSTSNFVLGVLIGRLAGPSAYGAYILAFTVWLVAVGIHRALVTEPIVIARSLDGDRVAVLRRGLEADLLLGTALGAMVAVGGVVIALTGSGDIGGSLIVLGFLLPLLLGQDYWRAMAFAIHRPGMALVNDSVFVVVQVVALAAALGLGARTAPWFLLAWGAGAGAGVVAGFIQFRVPPRRRGHGPMLSHTWPFSRWLLADFLTVFAADQTYLLLVAALLGQAVFGELKAALSLMGPTAVILLTGGNLGLPTLARARAREGIDGLVRASRQLTQIVAAAVLTYCGFVVIAGPWLLTTLYGDEFSSAGNLARIGAVQYSVAVAAFGAGIAIRVARQARALWLARLVVTAVSIATVVALSSWFGVAGAAWAGVITVAAATFATLRVFRTYVLRERATPGADVPAGAPSLPPPTPGTMHDGPVPRGTQGPVPPGTQGPWPPPALAGHQPR